LSFVIIMMTTIGWPVIGVSVTGWPPKPKARAGESAKPGSGLLASPAMSHDRRGDG